MSPFVSDGCPGSRHRRTVACRLVAFIAVAIVVGVALGLLTGGSFERLGTVSFRVAPLLALGVVVQVIAGFVSAPWGLRLVVTSLSLLAAFALANLHFGGMGLTFLGIAMNLTVITVNGGMPVRPAAVVAAGVSSAEEAPSLDFGAKRHLERPDDRLMWLADILPVPVAREVLSFGDLVMSVGVASLLVNLLRPRGRHEVLQPDGGTKV